MLLLEESDLAATSVISLIRLENGKTTVIGSTVLSLRRVAYVEGDGLRRMVRKLSLTFCPFFQKLESHGLHKA